MKLSRRAWMASTGIGIIALAQAGRAVAAPADLATSRIRPLPLEAVRLLPSDYARAVAVNRQYLLALEPDRLLHNFRAYAGLAPKAPLYGGWEADTIAGHTLGHYLSALALMWQQVDDGECRRRADYIVAELAAAQAARGSGYVGALGRRTKDGRIVDGEPIFHEVMVGQITSGGFDLNGSWSPLYTVHKVMAGLLDVHAAWGNAQALAVTLGLARYFQNVFAALDDAQMQTLLGCEYGGLNESYAELAARTGDGQWLAVAQRLYDRRVLDPLVAGKDELANFHANTQVPKVIGLARIHDLTGKDEPARAARFFWQAVTGHHSYVIGGNADREYFSAPDTIADHITEQTCEHCNSYNMLKLTRALYRWQPDAAWFDYYERTHLNHVMAAQDPETGGFTYMTPLMSGTAREYSTPDDDPFWCCVGTGMESHAKHGDSIFWEDGATLYVNLYIPAHARWQAKGLGLRLETAYPFEPEATLTLDTVGRKAAFAVALRVPGWARGRALVSVNGQTVRPVERDGYAVLARPWRSGDRVGLVLPLDLRLESAPGAPDTVAVLRGPLVMAADLGPAQMPWTGPDPAMVGEAPLAAFRAVPSAHPRYATKGVLRPADLSFVPFYSQYARRSAVYFKRFSDAAWKDQEAAYLAEQARARDIAARSVDVMHLGEMQPERDHALASELSYPVTYRGRNGRDARSGGYFEFTMKVQAGPMRLQASYWGAERRRVFDILVDGTVIATQTLDMDRPGQFIDVEYAVPERLTAGKASVRVRFVPHARESAGPAFGVRMIAPAPVANPAGTSKG
ncbi:glycoside hydrolase family 127 protein [Novosphingobium sp. SG720]|uniref:glycoside hydrolase family 127 protein n=1 Tax=Novosphingobium sp. SG720 TaxID=2586998 RepID=UPI0014485013|nr:glycoside hydrolase family 127 protein [Novosphingobium sp. SG720]NKJ40583.1 hypothetical protein [Novosphingobium sp. SG720]